MIRKWIFLVWLLLAIVMAFVPVFSSGQKSGRGIHNWIIEDNVKAIKVWVDAKINTPVNAWIQSHLPMAFEIPSLGGIYGWGSSTANVPTSWKEQKK